MLTVMLAPGSLNHTANIIKGFAIAIGIAIAIGFVWMWWASRQSERRQEMSARARAAWSVWLRHAVAYPELADPGLGAIGHAADVARYKAFVAALLGAADEVLSVDASPTWRDIIARHLVPHRAWLASPEFRHGGYLDCSAELQRLVASLDAGASVVPGVAADHHRATVGAPRTAAAHG